MEDKKSSFMKQVEEMKSSENFEKICNISLVNEGGEKLEDSVEKFNEGLKIYGEWLGKNYGHKKAK